MSQKYIPSRRSTSTADAQVHSRRFFTQIRSSEDGSSLVEFAVCLPPLLMVMTGIFVFSINISNYVSLTNATGSAIHALTVSRADAPAGTTIFDPCARVATAVTGGAPTLHSANLTYTTVINGTTYSGSSCASSSNTTGAEGDLTNALGKTATVTVTYPCNLSIYGSNKFPNCMLTARSSEMVQ